MTPRSVPASIERTWLCWWGGKKSSIRLIDSARVDRVNRRKHEVAGLGRRDRRRDGFLVAHLADQDHVGVLAQHAAQRALEGGGVDARPRAG